MFFLEDLPEIFIKELERFQLHWEKNIEDEDIKKEQKETQSIIEKTLENNLSLKKQFTRTVVGSEYAAKQFLSHPEILESVLTGASIFVDQSLAVDEIQSYLKQSLFVAASQMDSPSDATPEKKDLIFDKALRLARRDFMIRIIWRDLNRHSDLNNTIRELSIFAEQCISEALNYHYELLVSQWGVPVSQSDNNKNIVQPFLVLGMGKLGAEELNLSSDIDLIFAFPETGETIQCTPVSAQALTHKKTLSNQEFFIRLGQKIIKSLDTITADGFVFRVDMRLRPYGQSGALVMNYDSLENYYETQGREWERYAMIKARVVATTSDVVLERSVKKIESENTNYTIKNSVINSAELMALLQPFTFRKYLDFSVIESLRAMKLLITREVARKGLQADVKLGAGGIREVEFIAQAFQLTRGGRDPQLQERKVQKVLRLLAVKGLLPQGVDDQLVNAYVFLRNTEHAIQAYQDRQTQQLPVDIDNQLRLAWVMGFDGWETFYDQLTEHRKKISEQFYAVISDPENTITAEQEGSSEWALVWNSLSDTESSEGFVDSHYSGEATILIENLKDLKESRQVISMQASAREKLDALIPLLLMDLSKIDNPDQTLQRVCSLVEAIARRSVYIVLLLENPSARLQVTRLCSASSWIAEQLIAQPVLLDELLDTRQLYSPPDLATLKDELRREVLRHNWDDLESHMESLRYFRMSHSLRVAACEATNILPLMKASDYLTYIAEVILQHVLDLAWKQMVSRYGRPKKNDGSVCDPDFIIVGYGKLGGIELGHRSDLDLVFIHNGDTNQITEGPKEIDTPTFFTRLGQKIIHILNTQTVSGQLYEVDMRLRPSGNSGLLVTSLAAFEKYQNSDAWTWEHQALVRARVVAGSDSVRESFERVRENILSRERSLDDLKQEVCDMRVKMREHLGTKNSSKNSAEHNRKAPEITSGSAPNDDTNEVGLFHLKQDVGGIVDIEFMVQYAVLAWAKKYPSLMVYTDNIRILEALENEKLMPSAQVEQLIEVYKTYRSLVHRLALQDLPAIVAGNAFKIERSQVIESWDLLFSQ